MTVERLEGMPDGVLGFRSSGKLTREDYTDAMMPALRTAADSGEMRVVYMIGTDFHGLHRLYGLDELEAAKEWAAG